MSEPSTVSSKTSNSNGKKRPLETFSRGFFNHSQLLVTMKFTQVIQSCADRNLSSTSLPFLASLPTSHQRSSHRITPLGSNRKWHWSSFFWHHPTTIDLSRVFEGMRRKRWKYWLRKYATPQKKRKNEEAMKGVRKSQRP